MRQEWMEAVERTSRDWAARLQAETKLGSDLATRVAAARGLPEVAAAYQEWMTRQMELISKDWQKAMEDGQKFVNACARITGNGRGFGAS
jgi:hypothetical protein